MDSKPQRPLRPLQIQRDENAIPPLCKQQNLTRNKSTGNLAKTTGPISNMLTIGGFKAAAKRTAFGDVSNIAKNISSAHDDSAIAVKASDFVKPLYVTDKTAGFLRPAQRPLNAPPVKGTQASEAVAPAEGILPAKFSSMGQDHSAPAASRRTPSQRSTAVYKDNDENLPPQAAPTAPIHQALAPRHHKSQPQLKHGQLGLPPSGHGELERVVAASHLPMDGAEDEQATETNDGFDCMHMLQQRDGGLPQIASKATDNTIARLHRTLPQPPVVSEPEEYWEEEDDEEIYDEQGCTTAHSFRSRGDNTTGGATTVLFPKMTNKSKKELAAAKVYVEDLRSPEDIEDDMYDTSMVAEYSEEIFEYMRELELKMLPNPHYMDNQAEIQWSMRAVLMDWLIQVHNRFSLLPETLFLCVNYVDRFLSCKVVSLGKLQLVGATAIFVAAKYEEINCPSVSEIVFMVDGGYTVDEILKAERFMLSMLQFELGWPGPYSFLRRISKADEYDLETRTLAKYFLEVALMDERMVGTPASYIAAGAHCLSRLLLRKGDWSPAHVHYSGYTWTQVRPLVSILLECCENPEKHHNAVYEKFSDRRYKRTAIFVQAELQKGFSIPGHFSSRLSLSFPEDDAYESRDAVKRMVELKT